MDPKNHKLYVLLERKDYLLARIEEKKKQGRQAGYEEQEIVAIDSVISELVRLRKVVQDQRESKKLRKVVQDEMEDGIPSLPLSREELEDELYHLEIKKNKSHPKLVEVITVERSTTCQLRICWQKSGKESLIVIWLWHIDQTTNEWKPGRKIRLMPKEFGPLCEMMAKVKVQIDESEMVKEEARIGSEESD